jgi:predicted ester cyclase
MTNSDVVKAAITAIEEKNFSKLDSLLADDFKLSGLIHKSISKNDYVQVHNAISGAMPDFKFNLHDVKEEGDKVKAKVNVTGTNTGEFSMKQWGLMNFPATGNKIALPEENIEVTVENEKISAIYVEKNDNPEAGVTGVLKQLGMNTDFLAGL